MMNPKQIKLYSCYPANCVFTLAKQVREQIAAATRKDLVCSLRGESRPPRTELTSRDLYPPLPWLMADLPGTTWRNAYTHSATTIKEIRANRYGKLGPDPDEVINALFEIGLWRRERFIITGWVRVDHLDVEAQMDWHIAEVAYSVAEHHRAISSLRKKKEERHAYRQAGRGRDSCYGANLRIRQSDVERTGSERETATRAARVFAGLHGITFTVDTVNQIVVGQDRTAQLALL